MRKPELETKKFKPAIMYTIYIASTPEKVWQALTSAEFSKKYFFGNSVEVDLKVGGAYRYVWRGPAGDMGMGGVFREVVRPERIVSTEVFDDPWYAGEAVDTLVMVERDGKTTVTTTVRYASQQVRDAVLASGMSTGVAQSYDVLAELLAKGG